MYKKIRNVVFNNSILIELLILLVITGEIAQVPFYRVALFLYVQIGIIYLTGRTVLRFTQVDFSSRLSHIFFSYAIGYTVTLTLYLITLLFHAPKVSIIVAYIFSCMNIILYIYDCNMGTKKKTETESIDKKDLAVIIIAFFLASAFMFMCFQARMLSADITGYVSMYPDDQFWFREAVEGTRGIPMPDFSASGVIRCYHYFSGTWCSFLHYLTGIEIFDICFTFSWVGDLFLLVGGIYVLFAESNCIDIKYVIIALIAILFTSSAQSATFTTYINHLYVTHFGYLPGYAMGMYTFRLFIKWYECEKRRISVLVLCIILLLITVGIKAPCGCLTLVGMGVMCIKMFLLGKDRKEKQNGFIAGLLILISFIIFYKLLFTYPDNPIVYKTTSPGERFSLTDSLYMSGYFYNLIGNLTAIFENKYISYIVSYALYLFMSNFVVATFMLLGIHRCIKYRIFPEISEVASFMMVFCGYLCYLIISQNGYSQVYFMFALFPYGMYSALNIIARSRIIEKEKRKTKLSDPVIVIMLIALMGGMYKTKEYYSDIALAGLSNLNNRYDLKKEYSGSNGNDVNKMEMEALRWLRDNSDEDALLITNLAIVNNRSFTTSCYTERQIYIEGEAYGAANQELQDYRVELIRKYYLGDESAAETLIEEGVDYAVVFSSVPEYAGYIGNVIYDNNAVKIIEMAEQ